MNLANIYYLHEIGAKKKQEDYIWPAPGTASLDDRIFIVCDGVGGSQNGEIASRIISESVGTTLLKTTPSKINITLVNQLLNEAKGKLLNYARAQGLSSDMATTFSLLVFINGKAFISWCGDSRVYHIRKGEILFKTEDHSLVNTLVKNGEITEEEALSHPQKNIILKAIKADDSEAEADGHWIDDIRDGDYFMLCSDGLLENIGERDLRFLLYQNDKGAIDLILSFQQFCYDKTNDNYSMYLVKVKTNGDRIKKIRNRALLIFLLALTAAGAVFINKKYFNQKKPPDVVVPLNREKNFSDTTELKAPIKDTSVASSSNIPATKNDSKHMIKLQAGKKRPPSGRDFQDSSLGSVQAAAAKDFASNSVQALK